MRVCIKISYVLAVLFASEGCRHWSEPEFEKTTALPNVAIGDLRAYYGAAAGDDDNAANGAELTIADDIELSGRVISSTAAGNFYNTFLIDDGTGALEVMAGMYDLDATYRLGQQVSIRARGLAVGWRDGVMQLGLPPEPGSRYATGYFYHPVVIRPYVTAERDVAPTEPLDVRISELGTGMCGRLVKLSGLTVDELSTVETWASTAPEPVAGYVKFVALLPADSITVVTSGYASFAASPLPRETVSLTGILLYGKGESSKDHFLLKLRDEKDIDF